MILAPPTERSTRFSRQNSGHYAAELVEVNAARVCIKGKSLIETGMVTLCPDNTLCLLHNRKNMCNSDIFVSGCIKLIGEITLLSVVSTMSAETHLPQSEGADEWTDPILRAPELNLCNNYTEAVYPMFDPMTVCFVTLFSSMGTVANIYLLASTLPRLSTTRRIW